MRILRSFNGTQPLAPAPALVTRPVERMDSWRRTIAQFRDLVNSMAPGQRLTLTVAALLALAFFGLILSQKSEFTDEVPLSERPFTPAESRQAQAALRRAKLTAFRPEGNRIFVAAADVARYRAALETETGDRSGDKSSNVLGSSSFLSAVAPSAAQQQEQMDFAKYERVARLIEKQRGIADADVVANRSRKGYFGDAKSTAVLSVTLEEGVDLTDDFYRSLQRIVSSALGMSEEDVTVVDTRQGERGLRQGRGPVLGPDTDRPSAAEPSHVATGPGRQRGAPVGVAVRRANEKKSSGGLPGPWVVPAGVTILTTIVVGACVRGGRRRSRKRAPAAAPLGETAQPGTVVEVASGGEPPAPADDPMPSVSIPVTDEAHQPDTAAIREPEPKVPEVATGGDALPFPAVRTSASTPFGFLSEKSVEDVASCLTEEHPQTIALILSHLPASLAARLLEELPPATQVEVVRRVATSKPASPVVVKEVAESLKGRMAASDGLETMTEGLSVAARLLSDADRRSNGALLERLAREDSALVDRIRRMLFDFDDLLTLADDDIRSLYGRTERLNWALALKGASTKLKSKILGSLPPLASEALQEELHRSGPVRVGDIALAQQQIADQAGLSHAPNDSSDPAAVAA